MKNLLNYCAGPAKLLHGGFAPERKQNCGPDCRTKDPAAVLSALSPEERGRLYALLDEETPADIFACAGHKAQAAPAGTAAAEDLREPLEKSIRKRLPWLIALLALGMLVSSVVGAFEGIAAQLPLMIAFQSLILDMAGNSGTQSLAVTIRVLMDENVSRAELLSLIVKETKIGLINGTILGALSFGTIGLYLTVFKAQSAGMAFSISACTGIALLLAMILSSLSGTLIPLMFRTLNVDPAVASGPLITTVNDLAAVIVYYGAAWFLILRLLPA